MQEFIPQMEPWFDDHESAAVSLYLQSGGWVTEHQKTSLFEEMLSTFTKSKYCMVTTNGTISLTLALLAIGLKPGDEVLIPNLTMIATANAGKLIGINPVFVDIEKETLCMDLGSAQKVMTKKTKALIYVSLNGRSGDMKKVMTFCKEHNIFLIEDAAQSLGSYFHGKHLGTFGSIGSFSFSVPKIITTGQGGALVTNSAKHMKTLRLSKDFGRIKGGIDIHGTLGWNFKFTDIQAVIGIEQMKKLAWRINRKKQIYRIYANTLKSISAIHMIPTNLIDTCPWFVDIFVSNPSALQAYLRSMGIGSRLMYPPLTSQKIYKDTSAKVTLPVSYHYGKSGLWLPSSSKLTDTQIMKVCESIKYYYSH